MLKHIWGARHENIINKVVCISYLANYEQQN